MRRSVPAAALCLLLALAAACSSSGKNTNNTSSSNTDATIAATAAPTASATAATAASTAAATPASSATRAAKASPTETRGLITPTEASSPNAASVPLDASLAPALLTLSDLPNGWTTTDDSSSSSTSLFDNGGSSSTDLCGNDQLNSGVIGQDAVGFAPADFSQGLRILIYGVARYQSGKARAAMDNFQKALKDCGGTSTQVDNNGASAKLTVTPVKLPALGDQAAGFHVFAQSDGFDIGLVIIAVRKGDLLAVVADANLGADTPTDGLIESLAAKAATRLSAVKQ